MRFSWSFVLLVALGACSSHSAGSASVDSGDQGGGDDGSTAACTSVGGTCAPIATSSCPLLQQNAVLCGNVILVCCLPSGGETVSVGEGGQTVDSGPPAEAATPTDGPIE
jgi:hypothetical protein